MRRKIGGENERERGGEFAVKRKIGKEKGKRVAMLKR